MSAANGHEFGRKRRLAAEVAGAAVLVAAMLLVGCPGQPPEPQGGPIEEPIEPNQVVPPGAAIYGDGGGLGMWYPPGRALSVSLSAETSGDVNVQLDGTTVLTAQADGVRLWFALPDSVDAGQYTLHVVGVDTGEVLFSGVLIVNRGDDG